MPTEVLPVDVFDATQQNWNTHSDSTPYINAVGGGYISAYTQNVVDRNFSFQNTALTDFSKITSVKLRVYTKENSDVAGNNCALSKNGGSSWFTTLAAGFTGDSAYHWYEKEILSYLSSIADINAVVMKCTKVGGNSYTVTTDYAELLITYTSGVVEKKPLMDGFVFAD